MDKEVLASLSGKLAAVFCLPVSLCAELDIPSYAYDKSRKQYRSTAFLEKLASFSRGGYNRALGVVAVDLYVPGMNFVFGEADSWNQAAIVSLSRLDQRFYQQPQDRDLFLDRALKESVHELAHTYGLRHCPNSRCVLFFSTSLADTDAKGAGFCPLCLRRLKLRSLVG